MNRSKQTGLIPVITGAGAMFLLSGVLHSQIATANDVDWSSYNRETIEQDILPAYARFAEQTEALQSTTAALCSAADAEHLQQAQDAFIAAQNAWQGISAVQFGPVQFLMRNYSIQYWPDRKSIGRRQLQSTLQMPADTQFDQEFFHQASVSIKGFPALEQLLFSEDALDKLNREGVDCRLTAAIATNVNEMAQGIYSDWQSSSEEMLSQESSSDDDEESSSDVPELSVNLMKSLVEPIELIRDTKLLAVLGRGAEATYPHRAESWLSEQSLANIRTNLDAAHALYTGESAGLDQMLRAQGHGEIADQIEADFAQLNKELEPLGDSLVAALETHYDELKTLTASLRKLDESLNSAMQVLGVQLGFNSRDGD
ncbi:imelysin family protein [Marinobacterium lutimaris]|uniref:Predicted lipoprotein n=1 Tax=Marinobacterium lutimaris TaxID=568106 RepID=A0A1H6DGJ4_9GAMM|nr:imelysin family protein [Marinobacterium lutimaris]SEG84340.1 Predicted lipoprotein [Marinobacterium lutimaris]